MVVLDSECVYNGTPPSGNAWGPPLGQRGVESCGNRYRGKEKRQGMRCRCADCHPTNTEAVLFQVLISLPDMAATAPAPPPPPV